MPWWKGTVRTDTVNRPVACPECSGLEGVILTNLHALEINSAGEVLETICGRRVSCQRCGLVYSVSGTGIFKHDRRAFPLVPDTRPEPAKAADDKVNPFPIHTAPKPRRRPDG